MQQYVVYMHTFINTLNAKDKSFLVAYITIATATYKTPLLTATCMCYFSLCVYMSFCMQVNLMSLKILLKHTNTHLNILVSANKCEFIVVYVVSFINIVVGFEVQRTKTTKL